MPKSGEFFGVLPEFPKFKKLEISDKEAVEKITSKYPPYSDFNFISMWSWDIKGDMRLCQLHGNLVVRFTDYVTGEPFYSFLGDNKVNETAEALLQLSTEQGLEPKLKLIPEIVVNRLDSKFKVIEDRDNFDYIYKNEDLANLLGNKFHDKRYLYNKFKKYYRDDKMLISSNIGDSTIKDILKLDEKWAMCKIEKSLKCDIKNETEAVKKFFTSIDQFSNSKFLFLSLYIKEDLVSFSISSIINSDYVLCHFTKGDVEYKGVYEYMITDYGLNFSKIATFMNYEQDLGISSLRSSKNSFNPSCFLKKYVIMDYTI